MKWVDILKDEDAFLGVKAKTDTPQPGLGLADDLFYLMIQTVFQRKMYKKYARNLLCVDGTHNTTHYDNTTLFTLIVRDDYGHGELWIQPHDWPLMHIVLRCRHSCWILHCVEWPGSDASTLLQDFPGQERRRPTRADNERQGRRSNQRSRVRLERSQG
jgi:hypothetical protein